MIYKDLKTDVIWDETDLKEYYANMQNKGLYLDLTFEEFLNELIFNGDFVEVKEQ